MRKHIGIIAVMTLLVIFGTAVGFAASKPETLNVIHWRAEDAEVYHTLNKLFEEQHPNIKINMEITSSSNADYYSVLKTRVMGGGKNLDIFAVHPDANFYIYAKAGVFMDLSGLPWFDNINQGLLQAGQYNGKQLVLPQCTNVTGLFYNKRLFAKYNLEVPKTWEEFVNVCETFKKNGIAPISIGLADSFPSVWITLQMSNYEVPWNYYRMLENGEAAYTGEVWKKTLTAMKEMGERGYFQKNASGTKYQQSITLFAMERAAMLDSGTWSIGTVYSQNPDIDAGYMIIPPYKDYDAKEIKAFMAPSQSFGIYKNSKHKEEALTYLKFLYSKEAQEIYGNQTGQLVANTKAELSAPMMEEVQKLAEGAKVSPHYNCTTPKITGGILFEMGTRAIKGDNVEDIMKDAQAQVDSLIEE